jgi:predicted transcriptional regulator of viral defense system
MAELNRTEKTIIKALGNEILTVEELAVKAHYEVSGYFRRTVSSLRKRGILANKRPGYYLKPEFHYLIQDSIEH